MTDKELLQQALDALEAHADIGIKATKQIEAIKTRLAQPEKEWVGLTDEEVSEILDAEIGFNSCFGPEEKFARAIEAKLKEKNT